MPRAAARGQFRASAVRGAGGRVEITTSAGEPRAAAACQRQHLQGEADGGGGARASAARPTSRTYTSADGAPSSLSAATAAAAVPPPPRIDGGRREAAAPAYRSGVDDPGDVGVVPDQPARALPPLGFERHGVDDAELARHAPDLVHLGGHGGLERHGDGQAAPARSPRDPTAMKAGQGVLGHVDRVVGRCPRRAARRRRGAAPATSSG